MLKDKKVFIHEGIRSEYKESEIVVYGIPFDGTASFKPGARFAPQRVRNNLDNIETYSPYLEKDLLEYRICDLGDLSISFSDTKQVLNLIEKEEEALLNDGKKTIVIGGEHLVSFPLIKTYIQKYPDLHIIQLDAHADLRDTFLGEKLSHATVMRRVFDSLKSGSLWQFGIRSGTKEEFDFADTNTSLQKFDLRGIEKAVDSIKETPVYLSIDLDVLDPSILSGTGTPEPGGINFKELMEAFKKMSSLNIVGGDIVELSPDYDASGVSTIVACEVLRELAILIGG